MRLAKRLTTWLVFVLVLFGAVTSVCAQTRQDRTKARKLAGEALDLYNAGDYEAALVKFDAADELVTAPTLKLRVARCLDKLDRMIEAKRKYREVIEVQLKRWAPPVHRTAQKQATKELKQLLAEIPSVTIAVRGVGSADAVVELDGRVLTPQELLEKRPVDPGRHIFEARVDDREVSENIEVLRGEDKRVVLTVPDPPPALPPPDRTGPLVWQVAGWTSVGVGVVGVVMGTVAGVMVLDQDEELSQQCPNRQCPRSIEADVSTFDTLRTVSTAGFIMGGVGLALGTTLLLLAPPDPLPPDASVAVSPWVAPTGVGLRGRFW